MFGRPNVATETRPATADDILRHITAEMDFSFFSDTEIQAMFEKVLDNLLLPPPVKYKMMSTQTRDKKIQTILMHKEALNENKSNDAYEQLKSVLKVVKNAKVPDISSVIKIRVFLSTANKGGVDTFMQANGIETLQKHIDNRLDKTILNELDAALLFELLSCYKSVLNQESVTEQVVCIPGVVEQIVRGLRFEWKPVALLSLEMLSVCCFFSPECAHIVAKSFRRLAKARNEFPFAMLLIGLQETDIEVRAGVARLVNDLIMGLASIQDRSILFTELSSILYGDRLEALVSAVKVELAGLTSQAAIAEAAAKASQAADAVYSSEPSVSSMGSMSIAAIAADNQKRQFSIFSFTKPSVATNAPKPIFPPNTILPQGTMADVSFTIEECLTVRRGKESVLCCPNAGTMCGTLVAAKDMNETLTTALGIKKTKHRWLVPNKLNIIYNRQSIMS